MASPDDDLTYLSPSFDPSSLTIPQLRNVLVTHEITYPASAKKPQLIDLFLQDLKPRARKILAARDRVRRTSAGITNMPGSQEQTAGENDSTVSMLPLPTPRQRKPRKIVRASADSGSTDLQTTSSKHARQSETETDPDPEIKRSTVRKSRKSEVQPKVKTEEAEEVPARPPLWGGFFSDENPFQSGSSPLESGEHRRRTAGQSNDRKKSTTGRRKTEGVVLVPAKQADGITPPSSKTFEIPVSKLNLPTESTEHENGVEAGENFTPEEELELIKDHDVQVKRNALSSRQRKKSLRKVGTVHGSAPWVILLALVAGYATWWRQEKLAVSYCGIGRSSNALSNVQLPEWADMLQPNCEPCPQHAICYENMETRCEDDFVLQSHPLSLGGFIPLSPTCEPDGEKARRVKAVADKAVDELRQRKARAECGFIDRETRKVISDTMGEQELKGEVSKKRRRGMNDAEFDDLWKGALGEIKGREEVTASGHGPHSRLQSNSLARLSLSCAIRRSARLTLARYRLTLSLMTLLCIGLLYLRSLIRTSRSDTARVPSLVAMTLDRLATQAALHTRGDAAESWISVGQLRDDVLRDEFSDKRRISIWQRVSAVIERNANVRTSVREGRQGDVSRVWEWIGSVGSLEEPWSGGRGSTAGKRVSFGEASDAGTPDKAPTPLGGEMVERRKWDEGRPVY